MSDDQYSTGTPHNPADDQFADQDEQELTDPAESVQPLPMDADVSVEWSAAPAEQIADPLGGGQYPDDMFGVAVDEQPVSLPADAIAGGLADVDYAIPDERPAPLPAPAEPQMLADASIDPIPAPVESIADPTPPAAPGADMFSVDDLMDEPAGAAPPAAPPAAPGGDMFSVDDLMDDDEASGMDAPAAPPALAAPAPLAMPEPPVAPAAHEPLSMPEPPPAPEPLTMPDPQAAAVPPQPAPEPPAAYEPPPPELPPVPAAEVAPDPFAEPLTGETQGQFAEPSPVVPEQPTEDVLGPHGIIDSQAAMPASDFAFTDEPAADAIPGVPTSAAFEEPVDLAVEPAFEPLSAEPADIPVDTAPPDAEQDMFDALAPEQPEVVNPYAQAAEEATVADPAMSFGLDPAEVESQESVVDADGPTIINPYAQAPEEAGVVDPAMAFVTGATAADGADDSAMSDPAAMTPPEDAAYDAAYDVAAPGAIPEAPADPMASSALGTGMFDEMYGSEEFAPLPQTSRTESVAPPGMETAAPEGLVVAGGKRAAGSAKRGRGTKLSLGKSKGGRRRSNEDQASPPPAGPAEDYAAGPVEGIAPPIEGAPQPSEGAPPVGYEQPAAYGDQPAYPVQPAAYADPALPYGAQPGQPAQYADPAAWQSPDMPAYPASSEPAPPAAPAQPPFQTPFQAPAQTPAQAPAQAPVQAPVQPVAAGKPKKDGKSLADVLLGPVEPGQRHKLFGIPVGKPAPVPGQNAHGDFASAAAQPSMPALPTPDGPAMPQTTAAAQPAAAQPAAAAGEAKRGRKTKSAKPKTAKPKTAKPKSAKQGKSLADTLLGPVEPGQRHKLFGIPVGKPAPVPVPSAQFQPPQQTALPSASPVPEVPAVAGAEVIHSVEAAEHERGKSKRGRKAKQPRTAKPAKTKAAKTKPAKQGKSLADTLLGPVEPGQRHKLFGIPVGKPAAAAGQSGSVHDGSIPDGYGQVAPGQDMPGQYASTPEAAPPIATDAPQAFASPPAPEHQYAAQQQPVVPDHASAGFPAPPGAIAPQTDQDAQAPSAPAPAGWGEPPAQMTAQAQPAGMPDAGLTAGPPAVPPAGPSAFPQPGQAIQPPAFPPPPGDHYAQPQPPESDQGFPQPPTAAWEQQPGTVAQPDATLAPAADQSQQQATPPALADMPPPAAPEQTSVVPPDAPAAHTADEPPQQPSAAASADTSAAPSYLGGAAYAVPAPQQPAGAVADPRRMGGDGAPASDEQAADRAPVYRLAAWPQRALAQLVDGAIVAGLTYGLIVLLGVNQNETDPVGIIAGVKMTMVVLAGLAVTFYQAGLIAYNRGQTLGKKLMKIRVVREDGTRMDLVYGIMRETILKGMLSVATAGVFLVLNAVWPFIDKQNRALHDIIVKSRVVEDRIS